MDKKADIVMTSLKITPERSEQVDFSVPFMETGITILVAVRDGVISPTAFLGTLVTLTLCYFTTVSPSANCNVSVFHTEPYDTASWCFILFFSLHATGAAVFIFEWLSPSGLEAGTRLGGL